MGSEVAPCMPLQLFRRAATGGPTRRPRAHEVCRRLTEDLNSLGTMEKGISSSAPASNDREQLLRSVSEDVQKQLGLVLEVLNDVTGDKPCNAGDHPHEGAGEFLSQFLAADMPVRLVTCLEQLEFEVRKDVISVFSAIVRLGPKLGADQQIYEYAKTHPVFFELLVEGYANPQVATHCGMMLRSCARHRQLVEAFMAQAEVANRLIAFTRAASFDISSDAFSTLHDFLLTHKSASAMFLEANFQEFFKQYNGLLVCEDYVTQRQALKLLSEMLLDRTFMRVMLNYIGDEQFLQIHMNLLRADSKAIQFEAFHVFKIFVANPQKPHRVQQILFKNKDKLMKLLDTLKPNRPDDKHFAEDKATVIAKLQVLEAPPPKAPSSIPPVSSTSSAGGYPSAPEASAGIAITSGERATASTSSSSLPTAEAMDAASPAVPLPTSEDASALDAPAASVASAALSGATSAGTPDGVR